MPSPKRRKTNDASSEERCNVQDSKEVKEDERGEEVCFPELTQHVVREDTFGILNQAHIPQNINFGDENVFPQVGYLSALHSFVSVINPHPAKRVRLNLPNLQIPPQLPHTDEDAMRNLRILLNHIGFEVDDRATLAFFAIGLGLNVREAARCFLNLHKRVNSEKFQSPSLEIMQSMTAGLIEGFAQHRDGTFGLLCHIKAYDPRNHNTAYIAREALCYIFNMVDLSLLRKGFTLVANARNVTWRQLAPFEFAKLSKWFKVCIPLKIRGRFFIDPDRYVKVARIACAPLLPEETSRVTHLLSLDEVRLEHDYLVLPRSLTGLNNSTRIMTLSVERQHDFHFFL